MKYSQAGLGRIFVIQLEHGETVHEELERFAGKHGVKAASIVILGGVDSGSVLVTGPEDGDARPVMPMETVLSGVHEAVGTGTIFPDETGKPLLHMHIASGRNRESVTGCVRKGVRVWHVLEVVMFELVDTSAARLPDMETGFRLLVP